MLNCISNPSFVLSKASKRLYIYPDKLLTPYICHYTIMFNTPKGEEEGEMISLIPDASGCIVLTYTEKDIYCEIFGATTKLAFVKNDVDVIKVRVFIEFMPGGLNAITGIDQNEIVDLRLELSEVDSELYSDLKTQFIRSNTINELVEGLNNIFLKTINNFNQEAIILSSLDIIASTQGRASLKGISICENFSERHINRRFNKSIGMGIKAYSTILKVNKGIEIIKANKNINLASLSSYLGFYDQAHFIHSFKKICNVTPTQYIKNMSDFYNETFKYGDNI